MSQHHRPAQLRFARSLTALGLELAVVLMITALTPHTANAYERSRTNDGTLSHWFTHCIPIVLNQRASSVFTQDQIEAQLERASREWESPSCAQLQLIYSGVTSSELIGFDSAVDATNMNLIAFQSVDGSWIHDPRAVGLTTVTMCQNDTPVCAAGTIIDADIEFNEVNFELSVSERDTNKMDFAATLTHELGHLVGLDHSTHLEATMYAESFPGETKKRTLTEDDLNGVCDAFNSADDSLCILYAFDLVNGVSATDPADIVADNIQPEDGCAQRSGIPTFLWIFFVILGLNHRIRLGWGERQRASSRGRIL